MKKSASGLSLCEDLPPEEVIQEEEGKSLGGKSIGPWLSFIFVINQVYGPGVLAIPLVLDQSGVLPTCAMVTAFLLISSLASTCLAQAIAMIPGNREYDHRVEFGTAVEYYYGHRWHQVFQVCLNITVQAYNIASIVICAQSIDQAFIAMTGKAYAFEFGPNFGFNQFPTVDSLYSQGHWTISVGYCIITLFFLPAGFLNLNDNVKSVQVGSFVFLIALFAEFVGFFLWRGEQNGYHHLPVFGKTYSQLVSVFIFSWAYVIFIPSWLNEKSRDTSVNKVIWSSGIASWIGYIAIGILCAAVFSGSDIGLDNMLVSLSKPNMPTLTRVAAHLFSLGVIAPGIPVCSVTTRYNLFVGGVCSKRWSYFLGCVAPWIVGFVFCQGEVFANLLNWTSLLFNGLVNFIVPFAMYLTAIRRAQAEIAAQEEARAGVHIGIGITVQAGLPASDSINAPLPHVASASRPASPRIRPASPVVRDVLVQSSSSDLGAPLLQSPSFKPSPLRKEAEADDGANDQSTDDLSMFDTSLFAHPVSTDMHGPVYPLPKMLRPHAFATIAALAAFTIIIIVVQIGGDIYYASIGQDVLG